jgi:hypothetical protein
VFIGSSSEHIQTAEALKAGLMPYADATVWNDASAFELNDSIFGRLLRAADRFDFAVFVFDADDEALIRHSRVRVVRGNVLFEFDVFTGRIGRPNVPAERQRGHRRPISRSISPASSISLSRNRAADPGLFAPRQVRFQAQILICDR